MLGDSKIISQYSYKFELESSAQRVVCELLDRVNGSIPCDNHLGDVMTIFYSKKGNNAEQFEYFFS